MPGGEQPVLQEPLVGVRDDGGVRDAQDAGCLGSCYLTRGIGHSGDSREPLAPCQAPSTLGSCDSPESGVVSCSMTSTMTADQESPLIPRDTFAARLVLLRLELGLRTTGKIMPIEVIAEWCGEISPATWSTWERGVSPRDKAVVAKQISAATGCDLEWLTFGGLPLPAKWELLDGGGDYSQPTLPFLALVP